MKSQIGNISSLSCPSYPVFSGLNLCAFSMSCRCLELILLARSYWLISGFDFVVVMALMFVLPAGQATLIFLGCFMFM